MGFCKILLFLSGETISNELVFSISNLSYKQVILFLLNNDFRFEVRIFSGRSTTSSGLTSFRKTQDVLVCMAITILLFRYFPQHHHGFLLTFRLAQAAAISGWHP